MGACQGLGIFLPQEFLLEGEMSQSTNVNNQIACIPPVFSFFSTRRLRKKVSTRAFCAEFGAARGGRGEKKGCPHPNVHFGCDIIMTEPVPMLLTLNWGGSSTHGIGDDVQFVGLQSRGDLNGKNGQVISWIESRWRYGVRVNGTGEEIAAKPENIVSSQATCTYNATDVELRSGLHVPMPNDQQLSAAWDRFVLFLAESHKPAPFLLGRARRLHGRGRTTLLMAVPKDPKTMKDWDIPPTLCMVATKSFVDGSVGLLHLINVELCKQAVGVSIQERAHVATYPIHVIFGEQGELRAIFYAQTVIDALAWAEKNATTRRGYAAHIGVHYDEASRQYKMRGTLNAVRPR